MNINTMLNERKVFLINELERLSKKAADYISSKENSTSPIQRAMAGNLPDNIQKEISSVIFQINILKLLDGEER